MKIQILSNSILKPFARLIRNKRGAVTIEFFFMILFLAILFTFMADLVLLRSTLGKLDNASYTLVNVLRERTLLYDGNRNLSDPKDVQQMRQLAAMILYNDKTRINDFEITLESNNNGNHTLIGNSATCAPKPNEQLTRTNASILAPRSEGRNPTDSGSQIPLYQVTLCVKMNSLFKVFLLEDSIQIKGGIKSSSMSVGI